jgi:hypothetical protein
MGDIKNQALIERLDELEFYNEMRARFRAIKSGQLPASHSDDLALVSDLARQIRTDFQASNSAESIAIDKSGSSLDPRASELTTTTVTMKSPTGPSAEEYNDAALFMGLNKKFNTIALAAEVTNLDDGWRVTPADNMAPGGAWAPSLRDDEVGGRMLYKRLEAGVCGTPGGMTLESDESDVQKSLAHLTNMRRYDKTYCNKANGRLSKERDEQQCENMKPWCEWKKKEGRFPGSDNKSKCHKLPEEDFKRAFQNLRSMEAKERKKHNDEMAKKKRDNPKMYALEENRSKRMLYAHDWGGLDFANDPGSATTSAVESALG